MTRTGWAALASGTCVLVALASGAIAGPQDALITKHASGNGVPESLVRRVIHIESKGNPRLISKGNFGLMQIRLGTARSMGYTGTAEGLLDADTNMTYAVKYLASAYRAAGCSEERAIAYYQRGFYKKPVSNCAPRTVQVAAKKESAPAAPAKAQQIAAGERIAAPFDALRPKVVQVQTIVRPKAFNVAVQSVQTPSAQSSSAQPSAPVQVAAAPAAGPALVEEATDVRLPPSPTLPRPAQRPEFAAVQTVAKAPDTEQAWPPALTPEQPAEVMLPMPRPRPAKAPKRLAKLRVSGRDETRQDAVASDGVPSAEQVAADPAQPAALMLPMPKPRPAKAPRAMATPDVTGQDVMAKQDAAPSEVEVAGTEQAPEESNPSAESSGTQQIAKLDPPAVPLPQPRPEVDETPEHEGKPAYRGAHRHVHYRSRKPETPALIAFFQKLTTPPQPTRHRR